MEKFRQATSKDKELELESFKKGYEQRFGTKFNKDSFTDQIRKTQSKRSIFLDLKTRKNKK